MGEPFVCTRFKQFPGLKTYPPPPEASTYRGRTRPETVTREHEGVAVTMRRVLQVIERTIDKSGQVLLMLDIEVEG